ncbi:hypothetical protein [Paenibacillus soyae]|uniref:Uncharacterized protein n=1 Tax=Paenibacillus soyae TaxID=2969249 RepID=A0A9X2MNT5_9BACL|nr:hypothetical protein [Paenibacillus soyae]MCR2805393.1 hypothetical protein [Paenibacillus soyae]
MSDELLKKITEKHGIKYEYVKEIIECERRHVHKDRRPINGDLKDVIQRATAEGATSYDYQQN